MRGVDVDRQAQGTRWISAWICEDASASTVILAAASFASAVGIPGFCSLRLVFWDFRHVWFAPKRAREVPRISQNRFHLLSLSDTAVCDHPQVGVAVALVTAQAFGLSSFLGHLPFSSGRCNS